VGGEVELSLEEARENGVVEEANRNTTTKQIRISDPPTSSLYLASIPCQQHTNINTNAYVFHFSLVWLCLCLSICLSVCLVSLSTPVFPPSLFLILTPHPLGPTLSAYQFVGMFSKGELSEALQVPNIVEVRLLHGKLSSQALVSLIRLQSFLLCEV